MISDRDADLVYVSDRLTHARPALVGELLDVLGDHGISMQAVRGTRDVWCRDYMPVRVGGGDFVRFRYAPDYLRGYEHLITRPGDVGPIPEVDRCTDSEIVLDGGNVVRWGSRCIVTDKVFRENPGVGRADLLGRLREDLRVEDLIVIPTEPCDVVGHADGVVRFLGDRLVVLNDYSTAAPRYGGRLRSIFERAGLECVVLPYSPEEAGCGGIPSAVGCYANFVMVRGLVVVPSFGRREDDLACRVIEANTSGLAVVPLECSCLAREGGALNCVTWTISTGQVWVRPRTRTEDA